MTAFQIAVERRQWPLVSLYLLLGITGAANRLPAQALSELIDLLGGETEANRGGSSGPEKSNPDLSRTHGMRTLGCGPEASRGVQLCMRRFRCCNATVMA